MAIPAGSSRARLIYAVVGKLPLDLLRRRKHFPLCFRWQSTARPIAIPDGIMPTDTYDWLRGLVEATIIPRTWLRHPGVRLQEQLVRVDVRRVIASEHTGAAGVVRMRVRVDDGSHRSAQARTEGLENRARSRRISGCVNDDRPALALHEHDVTSRVSDGDVYATSDLDHLTAAMAVLEAADQMSLDREPNPGL